jgi:hypothetical protein
VGSRPARTSRSVWQKPSDLDTVLRVDEGHFPQASLSLGRLTRQYVTVVRFFSFDFTTLENGKPFGRSTACLDLWHHALSGNHFGQATPDGAEQN